MTMSETYKDAIEELSYELWRVFVGRKFSYEVLEEDKYTVIVPWMSRINKYMIRRLALNHDSYFMEDCRDKEIIEAIIKPFKKRLKKLNASGDFKKQEELMSCFEEKQEHLTRCEDELLDAKNKYREAKESKEYWEEELTNAQNSLEEFKEEHPELIEE